MIFIPTVLAAAPAASQDAHERVDEAIQNITALVRPGQVGYATFWDGNKFVQCRRIANKDLRCEAAGTVMQPSLKSALTGERLNRLAALGWVLDARFGNYAQTFPASVGPSQIADRVLKALTEGYGANLADLEIQTTWVADVPCPPRAGFSQNLAGSVNGSSEMATVVIRSCQYAAATETTQKVSSAAELIALHGAMVTAEIQRLRINANRRVYTVFEPGIGYIQCMPDANPPTLYCEAQSSESWPALEALLTSERVSLLHKAGYADPGRAPNYWKLYSLKEHSNAAIANEILSILHEVYGYAGAARLNIKTEASND